MCINKASVITVIVHIINVVIWVLKADWVHFRFMTSNCSFERVWAWGINSLVEDISFWSMFMIVLKDMFSLYILLDEQGFPERIFFQFFIILHYNYLTPLLLIPTVVLRYGMHKVLDIWKDLDWYCWTLGLWIFWRWFGTFWWKVLLKFLSTIGSIM